MPNARLKHRRVVHKSTAGILETIPEAVGLVGNTPQDLTENTVALPFFAREIREGEHAVIYQTALLASCHKRALN
jgi:hypothetical protein